MRNFTRTFRAPYLILFSLVVFFIAGCSDDKSTEAQNEAPEVPPVTSFQMDFTVFPTSSPKSLSSTDEMVSSNHWAYATLNVVFWQTLVTAGMVVPGAAFVESFNHEPEQQPDGSWMWLYDFSILGGVQHTAALHADVENSGVQWDMYISKQNEYVDFHWYSGWSDLLVTEGTWTLNHKPEDPSPWIGIVWHRNLEDGTADIKYTNIIPNDPGNGGYIFYGTTTDSTYDAFYNIFSKERNNNTDINWNRTTLAGQVRDSWHFGDNDWRCWNYLLEDIECP